VYECSSNAPQQQFHHLLYTSRTSYLLSRLDTINTGSTTRLRDSILRSAQLCQSEQEARTLLDDIWEIGNSSDTDSKPKGFAKKSSLQKPPPEYDDEVQKVHQFLCYLRFIEEMVTGYATLKSLKSNSKDPTKTSIALPKFVHGRFVSISPEHSIVRMGGTMTKNRNGNCSGVSTWGVGKRGQLGHNQRADLRHPTRLRYGIGYSHLPDLRIVQVSAGGGLVRVAHTLLLTSSGRVLSFGTGQYGALGHGYNAAKQLPDYLKPTFI
jgi:Regulator of chromosome condensation (RCC1) repeat